MAKRKPDDKPRAYASPPCAMHEVDPAYMNYLGADEAEARRGATKPAKTKEPSLPRRRESSGNGKA
jgi:hypothetical protein